MFFISDKAIIKANETVILRFIAPSSTVTNLSDYPATLMGSQDGREYKQITQLDKGQSKTITINHKYICVIGNNAIIYLYNHLPEFNPNKSDLVAINKPITITDGTTLQSITLVNASGTKSVATLATITTEK